MEQNIYFISDTHFYHNNIIGYCNRPFKNVEEMNETIINNWNNIVSDNDIIYHLGDLAFCDNGLLEPICKRLNGKKYLIRGNHDTKSVNTYEDYGFTVLRNPPIRLEKYKLFLSHTPRPDTEIPKGYVNVHGHIHNTPLNDVGQFRKNEFREYPIETYSPEKHICVCVDVTDFKPISINDIISKR